MKLIKDHVEFSNNTVKARLKRYENGIVFFETETGIRLVVENLQDFNADMLDLITQLKKEIEKYEARFNEYSKRIKQYDAKIFAIKRDATKLLKEQAEVVMTERVRLKQNLLQDTSRLLEHKKREVALWKKHIQGILKELK